MFQVLIGILTIYNYRYTDSYFPGFQVLIGILTIYIIVIAMCEYMHVSSPYRYSNNYCPVFSGAIAKSSFKSL